LVPFVERLTAGKLGEKPSVPVNISPADEIKSERTFPGRKFHIYMRICKTARSPKRGNWVQFFNKKCGITAAL
jgi:hypothetical protein